ncbi:MAG TPA: PIN domain-containing protein [Candidatus Kapabacteria bacterium]|nr:PIN domain-containing protein [Candidatus Kapabacteria bacterium]
MRHILDACVIIAYFGGEEGGEAIRDILLDRSLRISLHGLNACEVYYHFIRSVGVAEAERVIKSLIVLGTEIIDEVDSKLWKFAGVLKARYKKLSLADAIGVAYAVRTGATFITSDHAELRPLAKDKVCNFFFFR